MIHSKHAALENKKERPGKSITLPNGMVRIVPNPKFKADHSGEKNWPSSHHKVDQKYKSDYQKRVGRSYDD